MEPARWLKIEELFHAALDCDPGERHLYLDKACAADSELRQEVEELLRDHDATWSFFDKQPLKMKRNVSRISPGRQCDDTDGYRPR